MKPTALVCLLLAICLLPQFASSEGEPASNPPAPGFDLEGSDPQAVHIADEVMAAMGGRGAWDATRHFRWRFFGRRLHVWDKKTGDIRIEATDSKSGEELVILMNLKSMEGRAWKGGKPIDSEEERTNLLDYGEALWINDSYWMFMPYKLKDTGVTLRMAGKGTLGDGREADVLELTFEEVGRTPENKYRVYVARDTRLVERWDFYADASDAEPRFSTPWSGWKRYGQILLAADRGDNDHTDIAVFDSLPESVYFDPSPVGWDLME